ncbi:RES family NAD+ phosphorylase [soil metagenome]
MSGQGAYLYGGRWNSPEHRVVYASGNLSLAMLEVLVHIDDAEAFVNKAYVYHLVEFDEADVSVLEPSSLPPSWNARPETRVSQGVGDEFLDRVEGVVLAVPSVVVPTAMRYDPLYMTYLINPVHPKYAKVITVGETRPLDWDPRLT